MTELTQEQRKAYDRFIKARDRVGLVRTHANYKNPWVRFADVEGSVDVEGLNHPLFIQNDAWLEYKEAFQAWLDIEPKSRNEQRMRMSRGDYGVQDSWDDKQSRIQDSYSKFKENGQ